MTQRIVDQRSTDVGLGIPADSPDGEGTELNDDELMPQNEAETAPRLRASLPRITQRPPRLSLVDGPASEGEILLGPYRVERVVARTAHEIVVEASHLHLRQRVILRHLTAAASASPEAVARFQRGARKAREMRSEHAERVVDCGHLESGAPYRAVELPRGPSLAEILRVRGQLPVAEAVDIVLAACEPIAEAHASGIVHRCLSTHNVFTERRPDGTPLVRVLDFGVTDPLEPDWINGDEMPVPGASLSIEGLRYVSPEQIRNPTAVDARADIWALGVILHELLAGGPLFNADGSLTLLSMIVADAPPALRLTHGDVPPELDQLVLSCLEKEPAARPRSVVELALALAPFGSSDAEPAAARVARLVTRSMRPPPLPSPGPLPSLSPASRTSRAGALAHSLTPSTVTESPARSDSRGMVFLFAGAAIGLSTAIAAMFVVRRSDTTPAAAAVSLPAPAAATQPTSAPTLAATVNAAPAPWAALPSATAGTTSASRPTPALPRSAPASASRRTSNGAPRGERTPVTESAKVPVAATQPVAKADENLFGSVD
jgi:serine/threonine protein kinase